MQILALKELDLSGGRRAMPGDAVPEAEHWDACWFRTGHVGVYPDEVAEHVRRHLRVGAQHLVADTVAASHHLGVSIAEHKADRAQREPITADAGPTPTTAEEPAPDVADAAADDAGADAAPESSDTFPARRVGRRRRG